MSIFNRTITSDLDGPSRSCHIAYFLNVVSLKIYIHFACDWGIEETM